MKKIGYILVAAGLALLCFVLYLYFSQKNEVVSPVPDDKGVKVIFEK